MGHNQTASDLGSPLFFFYTVHQAYEFYTNIQAKQIFPLS